MKQFFIIFLLYFLVSSCSDRPDKSDLKSLLVGQVKNTHTTQGWFVPTNIAIKGLTAEQSNWKDSTENHSIGELVSHITFWSEMNLRSFKGEEMSNFDIDNEVTFKMYNDEEWQTAVKRLDSVQSQWEMTIEKATKEQLNEWSSEIANMTSHNAYHTGQIVYIRKRNGWWKKMH